MQVQVVEDAEGTWLRVRGPVDYAEAHGMLVVVWMPIGESPLFHPFQDRASVVLLDGRKEIPEGTVCPVREAHCAWSDDPTLAVPGDGHPTAKANALFARVITRAILKRMAATPGKETP